MLGAPGRGTIGYPGRSLVAIALGPFDRDAAGHLAELRSSRRRPTVIDDEPPQPEQVIRSQCRISVGHEGLLVWRVS